MVLANGGGGDSFFNGEQLSMENNLGCLSGKPPHGFHAGGFSAYAARFLNKP